MCCGVSPTNSRSRVLILKAPCAPYQLGASPAYDPGTPRKKTRLTDTLTRRPTEWLTLRRNLRMLPARGWTGLTTVTGGPAAAAPLTPR